MKEVTKIKVQESQAKKKEYYDQKIKKEINKTKSFIMMQQKKTMDRKNRL